MPNFVLTNARQTKAGSKKFSNINDHEASGDSPSQAAKKIMSAVCKEKKIKGRCALKLVIRKKGSGDVFKYHATRKLIPLKDRVKTGIKKADGTPLTFKYTPEVKRIFDSKPSSAPTPKKSIKKASTKKTSTKKTSKANSAPVSSKKSNSWLNRVFGI